MNNLRFYFFYRSLHDYFYIGEKCGHYLLLLFLFYAFISQTQSDDGLILNEFIRHFEAADFNLNLLQRQHKRIKRSANLDTLKFNFTAHNRLFQIILHSDAQNIFSEEALFENTNGPFHYDIKNVYSGYLQDTPKSHVQGIITNNGYFDGHILTPFEDYYIEPANRYFNSRTKRSPEYPFHSVIYKSSDIITPSNSSSCKSHDLQFSTQTHLSFKSPVITVNSTNSEKQTLSTTYQVMDWSDVPENVKHHFRKKNEYFASRKIDEKKTTCMLYLQADHLFFTEMGSEESAIEVMTRHVQRVNSIYQPIDFDQDGRPDNIAFMIKRIKVHTNEALKDKKYRFPGNYGVEKFLEIFSEENYDAFCLAYMFTYRDFEGGTLGLAWTGDLKNAGGVCERNGHYRGSLKSLNTGIITLLNYGKLVPPAVSHVTMAHEMGHNFGSPHDPENNKDCVPGGEDGNYIMFARATSGDKKNNRQFSPCSLKMIKDVLKAKARASKGCFTEPQEALCGNGVVEEGEECDCGWEEDCEEKCCWPQRTEYDKLQIPCTLRPNTNCSPTQGPCCNNNCEYNFGNKCRDDNGCRAESFCNGVSSTCPSSLTKPNKTVCNKEFVCYKGECTGSICLAYGMESCQCSQGPEDSSTKACELCCKKPGDQNSCLSSFELNEPPYDVPEMFSKPGTPCNNYLGYCDVFQKCREIDPSGPLATLRKLLLSEESIETLRQFLIRHWYTVILGVLAVFAFMGLIIKFCGKKTPLLRRRRKRKRKNLVIENENVSVHNEEEIQVHPEIRENLEGKVKINNSRGNKKKKSGQNEPLEVRVFANHLSRRLAHLSSHHSSREIHRHKIQRRIKSLSPNKLTLASNMAVSITSLSKSFEKLNVGRHRRKRRKSRIQNTKMSSSQITVAKIGRFKLCIEDGNDKLKPTNTEGQEPSSKKKISARLSRSLSLDRNKVSKELVMVSKKPKGDRPLVPRPKSDYRQEFNSIKKFRRCASQPYVQSSESQEALFKNHSFVNDEYSSIQNSNLFKNNLSSLKKHFVPLSHYIEMNNDNPLLSSNSSLSDKIRQSPPTQVQSLSSGSSFNDLKIDDLEETSENNEITQPQDSSLAFTICDLSQ